MTIIRQTTHTVVVNGEPRVVTAQWDPPDWSVGITGWQLTGWQWVDSDEAIDDSIDDEVCDQIVTDAQARGVPDGD